ncbi:MAG: putative O-glycosylation ligase, exosortase A system-associated [Burkholderiaceae bacterium]|jgi:probable O-glycosylation ligase (exosortase A-associated)|nr:putative O-glycosylation ligase, exosortase A system-associated [Burkholderiaceae bacterium]
MRDIAITALVGLLLLVGLKHPVVAAYLYTWLSLMNPHKLAYGFAFAMPFAQAAAALTLVMLLLTRQRQPLPSHPVVYLLLAFFAWMSITSLTAMAPPDRVWDRWTFVLKIYLMVLVTWMLVVDARQLRVLVWVVTLSVCFYGIKGGVWTVLTGGGSRVWGPPGGMLQGNNELAVGLVLLMPMLYWLRQTSPHRWVRHLLLFFMISCSFSILGSQSRGALLALLAMGFFLGLKGKYPVRTSLGLLVLVAVAVVFMPESWSERMDTMRTYQEDTSAMSRIWTWMTLFNAAMDHPLRGVGFAADNHAVFGMYSPQGGEWSVFAGRVYVAHSIYFQILGEHGFMGLALFLGLGLATWLSAASIARRAMAHDNLASWMPLLARMVQVSLIGYAAGGAFLSLGYLDLPLYIIGFVVLSSAILKRQEAEAAARPAARPAAEPLPGSQRRLDDPMGTQPSPAPRVPR